MRVLTTTGLETAIVLGVCQYKMHHFPVYKKDRDNFIGFIHAADVAGIFLDPELQANDFNIKSLLYDPIVIPPTKKVNEMLDFFKTHEIKSAIVLNEFGGVERFFHFYAFSQLYT
jgi:Mg2+/Co2+ transporter CorC